MKTKNNVEKELPAKGDLSEREQLIKLAEDDKRSLNTKCEMMLETQIALEKQKREGKK